MMGVPGHLHAGLGQQWHSTLGQRLGTTRSLNVRGAPPLSCALACAKLGVPGMRPRYLESPRTNASQTYWGAWQPAIVLPGGALGKEEVCDAPAYVNRFVLSVGSAVVNANSTKAFRESGILGIQGRCSNGRNLGYYGPPHADASVAYQQENIQVGPTARCPCPPQRECPAVSCRTAWVAAAMRVSDGIACMRVLIQPPLPRSMQSLTKKVPSDVPSGSLP